MSNIPEHIVTAIDALLAPYNTSLSALTAAKDKKTETFADDRGYCGTSEAAKYIHCHPYTLARYIREGKIKAKRCASSAGNGNQNGNDRIAYKELDRFLGFDTVK